MHFDQVDDQQFIARTDSPTIAIVLCALALLIGGWEAWNNLGFASLMSSASWLFFAPIGLALMACVFITYFGTRRYFFDRVQGTITIQRRLLFFIPFNETFRIKDFECVYVEETAERKFLSSGFPVKLIGTKGTLRIAAGREREDSEQAASWLADATGLPVRRQLH